MGHIAWIFDVDGVLVHLEKRELVEMELLDEIIKRLALGDAVALISGRSSGWQNKNVVALLREKFAKTTYSPTLLDNLYISGEFGGTAIAFTLGEELLEKDTTCLIPKILIRQLEETTAPFLNDFFIDPKETIFTVVGKTPEGFQEKAEKLRQQYLSDIEKLHLSDQIEVHKDTTALNVKYKKANKHYATQQAIAWLAKKHMTPTEYIAFGDSNSDIEIGEELTKQKIPFTFVFVGNPDKLEEQPPFPLTMPREKYDKGTLEFLQEFPQS